jgi:hypothetical protein
MHALKNREWTRIDANFQSEWGRARPRVYRRWFGEWFRPSVPACFSFASIGVHSRLNWSRELRERSRMLAGKDEDEPDRCIEEPRMDTKSREFSERTGKSPARVYSPLFGEWFRLSVPACFSFASINVHSRLK